jgi:signal peptidase II
MPDPAPPAGAARRNAELSVPIAAASPRADDAAAAARPGVRTLARRFGVVVLLIALDLWSKSAVFAWFASHGDRLVRHNCGNERLPLFGDGLAFMLSLNPGMAWGFDRLSPYVLVLGRAAAVIFLAYVVVRTPQRRRWLAASLVLILAGALGNLHDNLLRQSTSGRPFGEVRDFIDVYFARWDYHFPTFNVADSCITVGAVVLFLCSLRKEHAPGTPIPEVRSR